MSKNKLFLLHQEHIQACIRTGSCRYFGRSWTLIEYLRHFFLEIFNLLLTESEQRTLVKTFQCGTESEHCTILTPKRYVMTPGEVLQMFPEFAAKTAALNGQVKKQGADDFNILAHAHPLHICHLECVDCWAEHLENHFLNLHYRPAYSAQFQRTEQLQCTV